MDRGRFAATLVSSRSAKQYSVPSNAAPEDERVRSLSIDAGTLDPDKAVESLGTGLYISNLHYLNWSDNDSGRVTGMTRFACFWVEEGRIAAPIRDMRFDESIYHLFGDKLLGLGSRRLLGAGHQHLLRTRAGRFAASRPAGQRLHLHTVGAGASGQVTQGRASPYQRMRFPP